MAVFLEHSCLVISLTYKCFCGFVIFALHRLEIQLTLTFMRRILILNVNLFAICLHHAIILHSTGNRGH